MHLFGYAQYDARGSSDIFPFSERVLVDVTETDLSLIVDEVYQDPVLSILVLIRPTEIVIWGQGAGTALEHPLSGYDMTTSDTHVL